MTQIKITTWKDRIEESRKAKQTHVWTPGDRAVVHHGIGVKYHTIFVREYTTERQTRLHLITDTGKMLSRGRQDVTPHTKGRWKGPKDLKDALRRWHARELGNLRGVEATIRELCPEALGEDRVQS